MRWRALRSLASMTFFPAMLAGGVAWAMDLQQRGLSDPLVVFLITLLVSFPILALQRLLPYEPSWRGTPSDFRLDLLHLLLSNALVASVARALAFGVVSAAAVAVEARLGHPLWPMAWPVVAQLALAVVVGDFFSYWAHRSCHTNRWMWRIHALHHSTERMYALAAGRNHPFNVALTYVALTLPLILFGCPPEVLALHAVFNTTLGLLQHSNVDLWTRPFGWVLSTPELHRWHHSLDRDESSHNFGTDTAVWDVLFGTRHCPRDRKPVTVGLADTRIPPNLFHHFAVPFALERYQLPAALPPAPERPQLGPPVGGS